MSFGKKIKKMRVLLGWDQFKLANYLGLSQQTISKYERDQSEPDFKTLIKLSELFNTSIDYRKY